MASNNELPAIENYEMVKELGQGGFGKVYHYRLKEGIVSQSGRPSSVAVKVTNLSLTEAEQTSKLQILEREIRILSALSNRNIVKYLGYLDNSREGQVKFSLVMELCDLDLAELVKLRREASRNFSSQEAAVIIRQVLEGLKYLYNENVVHRDMKPLNILITTEKPNPDWRTINVWEIQAKIADFGMARVTDPEIKESFSMTAIGGTPDYIAPEMLLALMARESRFRSNFTLDYFAVGVMSFYLVTGGEKLNNHLEYTDPCKMTELFGNREPDLVSFLRVTTRQDWRNRDDINRLLEHSFSNAGEDYVARNLKRLMQGLFDAAYEQTQAQIVGLQLEALDRVEEIQRGIDGKVDSVLQQEQVQTDQMLAQVPPQVGQMIQQQVDRAKVVMKEQVNHLQEQMDGLKSAFAARASPKLQQNDQSRPHGANQMLWRAASQGNLEEMRAAFAEGAEKDSKGSGTPETEGFYYPKCTPLQVASGQGHLEAVKLLLSKGANVHSKETYKWTALFFATRGGHDQVVSELINHGAKVNQRDKERRTPLMWAAMYGRVSTVKLLLELGADPSLLDEKPLTASDLAGTWKGCQQEREAIQALLNQR